MKIKLLILLVSAFLVSQSVQSATDYTYRHSDGLYRSTHDDITTVGRKEAVPSREYSDKVREELPVTYTGKKEAIEEAKDAKENHVDESYVDERGRLIH